MVVTVKTKPVPFDAKEITDALVGVRTEEEYGSFIRSRDIRRKALPEELPKALDGKPKQSTSFGNLKKIKIDGQ